MAFYDSSVVIEYLDGDDDVVDFVETHRDERAVITPLILFEVYQGEVYKTGQSDFDSVDSALNWLTVVDEPATLAREAAELQDALLEAGTQLAARDAFIAGSASGLDERLVVTDDDFDIDALRERLEVVVL